MVRLNRPSINRLPRQTKYGLYAGPTGCRPPVHLPLEWIQPWTPPRTSGTPSWKWDTDGFIAQETLWVTPPEPADGAWAQGVDGHEQLEQRLSGSFDLPLRLLEWADQAVLTAAPSGIDANFGTALLATMRDVMRTTGDPSGKQVMNRPDSGTVAEDIARVSAPADDKHATADRSQSPDVLRPVRSILSVGRTPEAALSPSGIASGSRTDGIILPRPGATPDSFKIWLKLIHRARAFLFDPVNLRAFYQTGLGQCAPGNALLPELVE